MGKKKKGGAPSFSSPPSEGKGGGKESPFLGGGGKTCSGFPKLESNSRIARRGEGREKKPPLLLTKRGNSVIFLILPIWGKNCGRGKGRKKKKFLK